MKKQKITLININLSYNDAPRFLWNEFENDCICYDNLASTLVEFL